MAKETKYSLKDLKRDFPDDATCLAFIFDALHSRKCSCGGMYRHISSRKQFQCSKCRFQIAPTAGTIFHKSKTPLTSWFHAIWIFSNAKSGISAAEMERQLGVTYKCAWRILYQIRKSLSSPNNLFGEVEADGGYFGGKVSPKEKSSKPVALVAIERKGRVAVKIVRTEGIYDTQSFIRSHILKGSNLYTDGHFAYKGLEREYRRKSVIHHKKEYVRGKAHVNNAESFFGHVKRSINGTFKVVSRKYLQTYLDAFAFHWSNRHNDRRRFSTLLDFLLHA